MVIKHFNDLTTRELYSILKLRAEVFIIEQDCNYLDPDGKDIESFHVLLYADQKLVGTCRILPPGISYKEASIGRVCVAKDFRKQAFGKVCMSEALKFLDLQFPHDSIKISAQSYLTKFYSDFGFEICGEEYLEDNLPHFPMILKR